MVSEELTAVKLPPASAVKDVRATCFAWLVLVASNTIAALVLFYGPDRSGDVGNANCAPTFFRSLLYA